MVVCHCFAVNDRALAEAVARGARTVDDVVELCGAGGRCGGCRPLVAELLSEVGVTLPARQSSAA